MNKVILTGRFTQDLTLVGQGDKAVLKGLKEGKTVPLYLAVDKRKKRDQEKPDANFIPVVAFGKTAETICQFFSKGSKILIEGALDTGSYQKNDGSTEYTWSVTVSSWEFAESKKEQTQQAAYSGQPQQVAYQQPQPPYAQPQGQPMYQQPVQPQVMPQQAPQPQGMPQQAPQPMFQQAPQQNQMGFVPTNATFINPNESGFIK